MKCINRAHPHMYVKKQNKARSDPDNLCWRYFIAGFTFVTFVYLETPQHGWNSSSVPFSARRGMPRCCEVVYEHDGAHKCQIVLVHPIIGVNKKDWVDPLFSLEKQKWQMCERMGGLLGMEIDQRGEFLCCSVPVGEQKHSRMHETCLTTSQPLEGGETTHNPQDKQRKVTITESNLSASSANTSTHACTCAHMHH